MSNMFIFNLEGISKLYKKIYTFESLIKPSNFRGEACFHFKITIRPLTSRVVKAKGKGIFQSDRKIAVNVFF